MTERTLAGKKLLILSGNNLNQKLVEAAKDLGVYTIVADYLDAEYSPVKRLADEHWEVSYADTELLTGMCREHAVDGVLACYREATQLPYLHLCSELNLPCYGTEEQFKKLANKRAFKALCTEHGVEVIREYSEQDIAREMVQFPVFVKPADNGGSKGQSICNTHEELEAALCYARSESASNDVIIEQYIEGKNSFQVTYFFVNGEAYVIRTVDGYKGAVKDQLDRVCLCSVSPSQYTCAFLSEVNDKIVAMLKDIGVENGPVMLQGFYDNGIFRFYDPGRRFPGTDFELIYKDVFGIDLVKMMVVFAVTGKMPDLKPRTENVYLNGKTVVVLFPTLKAGKVGEIRGYEKLEADPRIRSVKKKYSTGDTVRWTYTTMQRACEVDFLCDGLEEARDTIRYIQDTIIIKDMEGKDMFYKPFDADRIKS